jgi:hypothetical protein
MTAKKIGIWMDHEHAHLTEFTVDPLISKTITSEFTKEVKEESLSNGENHMHVKEQHKQSEYYKKLGEVMKQYKEVLLFGPTNAKAELFNTLCDNHLFKDIKIKVEQTDKMSEHQMHAYIKKHFSAH